jgi:subtilase family serine protease
MFSRTFISLLSLVVVASGSHVPHASRPAPPTGFLHQGAAPEAQTITLRVGLASANTAGLEAKLRSISNPTSPEYGQWLTAGICFFFHIRMQF